MNSIRFLRAALAAVLAACAHRRPSAVRRCPTPARCRCCRSRFRSPRRSCCCRPARRSPSSRSQASAAGTVWVLERASDGARATLTLSGQRGRGCRSAAGTAVVVTAISTGWVLSAAGQAIAFIPNEIGAALLYNERMTR